MTISPSTLRTHHPSQKAGSTDCSGMTGPMMPVPDWRWEAPMRIRYSRLGTMANNLAITLSFNEM